MFPVQNFQALVDLCKRQGPDKSKYDVKIVAFILHEPFWENISGDLQDALELLHEVTGLNLAFVTCLKPRAYWRLEHSIVPSGLPYYKISQEENVRYLNAIRRTLALPSGSAILLSGDLDSDRFAVLPTNMNILVEQLRQLNSYAKMNALVNVDSDDFKKLLKHLAGGAPAYTDKTCNGLGLAETLGSITPTEEDKEPENTRLNNALNAFRSNREPQEMEWPGRRRALYDLPFPDWQMRRQFRRHRYYIEAEAAPGIENLMGDFSALNILMDAVHENHLPERQQPIFRLLCASLGILAEDAINASLIQFIRKKHFGIEMPEFYGRQDRRRNNCPIYIGARTICLNTGRRLSLGDSANVIFQLRNEEPWLERFQQDDFLYGLNSLSDSRNLSLHRDQYNDEHAAEDTFENMLASFNSIFSPATYLPALMAAQKECLSENAKERIRNAVGREPLPG